MDDNTFLLRIWRLAAGTICVLVVSIAGCSANDSRILAQMVRNGADPIAARCALGNLSTTGQVVCAVQAAKESK